MNAQTKIVSPIISATAALAAGIPFHVLANVADWHEAMASRAEGLDAQRRHRRIAEEVGDVACIVHRYSDM